MTHVDGDPSTNTDERLSARADEICDERLAAGYRRADHGFAALFVAQWIFSIAVAVVWSPFGWEGKASAPHVHVFYALFFGAALTFPTLYIVRRWPGTKLTRYTITALQFLWSALLIHLSGGRIETHFHVFGSLAFIAFYRDWKLLVVATLTVSVDHLLRGLVWAESVYGLANPEWWRFLEHAFWVVFENVVLVLGILTTKKEMRADARRQATLESVGRWYGDRVDLQVVELERAHSRLLEASRKAGMAEVAISVLHNVGNVLNSASVSAAVVAKLTQNSKVIGVQRGIALLCGQPDPAAFLADNPKGKKLMEYFRTVAPVLDAERAQTVEELKGLEKNIDHISVIIRMQQSNAKAGGVVEHVSVLSLIDEALKLDLASYERHGVEVVRDFEDLAEIEIERHKVLQILVNLLSNARHAVRDCDHERRVTIRARRLDDGKIAVEVEDNGVGIPAENLDQIFTHGFTTKKDGHGFGLHASACAAVELGGKLTVSSDGEGRGAIFRLVIPRRPRSSLRVAA